MLTELKVQIGYQYFYRRQYGNEKYRYIPTDAGNKLITGFLKLLKKHYKESYHSLGGKFLFNYFHFQFMYWDSIGEIDNFSNKIIPSLLLGKVGFSRYSERDQSFDWLLEDVNSNYLIKKNIKKSKFIEEVEFDKKIIFKSEDILRSKNYNTDLGFQTCILYTSLFNNKNTYCIMCKYRNECKEILRVNFSELYAKRGYDKEKS